MTSKSGSLKHPATRQGMSGKLPAARSYCPSMHAVNVSWIGVPLLKKPSAKRQRSALPPDSAVVRDLLNQDRKLHDRLRCTLYPTGVRHVGQPPVRSRRLSRAGKTIPRAFVTSRGRIDYRFAPGAIVWKRSGRGKLRCSCILDIVTLTRIDNFRHFGAGGPESLRYHNGTMTAGDET